MVHPRYPGITSYGDSLLLSSARLFDRDHLDFQFRLLDPEAEGKNWSPLEMSGSPTRFCLCPVDIPSIVMTNIAMENNHAINGKNHYKW